jgi:glyoxylase-like metal-dependent hydrolase (beta-lactamase superfamily II)
MTDWPGAIELTPAVTVLTGAANGKYPSGNSVLVRGTDAAALIDPSLDVALAGGPPADVRHVVLSHVHEDHIAGLFTVPTSSVWAHPADLVGLQSLEGLLEMYGMVPGSAADVWAKMLVDDFHYVARPDASALHPGTPLDLGSVTVRLEHLPGHTRGHCAVVIEQAGEDTVAFVGDIDLSSFGPYYGDAWSALDDFVTSLERVTAIDARWFVTGSTTRVSSRGPTGSLRK